MKRLTADQWESARAMREIGTSYEDVAKKFGVTRQAIMKRAKAEGWKDDEDVAAIVRRKTAEKVAGVVTVGDPQKKAAALDAAAFGDGGAELRQRDVAALRGIIGRCEAQVRSCQSVVRQYNQ